MDGTALANAIRAARSFVASKSPNDRIMLIGFGRQAIRLTDFSSSTIDVDAQLAGLAVDDVQGTALYDAVALGSRALAAEANAGRVLIVLTDGDDVSSRTTLGKAANQARRAGAAVYAIGIEGEGFSPQALTELARVTGGAYFPAENSSAVAGAYESIAEQLRRTWRVTYLTAARPGEEIELAAAVPGGASGSATATMPGDSSDSIVKPSAGSKLLPGVLLREQRRDDAARADRRQLRDPRRGSRARHARRDAAPAAHRAAHRGDAQAPRTADGPARALRRRVGRALRDGEVALAPEVLAAAASPDRARRPAAADGRVLLHLRRHAASSSASSPQSPPLSPLRSSCSRWWRGAFGPVGVRRGSRRRGA